MIQPTPAQSPKATVAAAMSARREGAAGQLASRARRAEAAGAEALVGRWCRSCGELLDRRPCGDPATMVGVDHSLHRVGGRSVVPVERSLKAIGDLQPADLASQERRDRLLVGGVEPGRRGPASPAGLVGQAEAGEGGQVGRLEVEAPERRPVDPAEGVRDPVRVGRARSRSGSLMSGWESCAMVAPSLNSTIEWTTDWGCTTTSMASNSTPNSSCASMTSRPLFISVDESTVIFGPIDQVGWASASSTVTPLQVGCGPPPEGPARGGQNDARDPIAGGRVGYWARRHWWMAQCSLSTGISSAPGVRAVLLHDRPRRDEGLLVGQRQPLPAFNAAIVTPRPANPTTPLTQTSAVVAIWASASGPARTSVPGGTSSASSPARSASARATTLGCQRRPARPAPRPTRPRRAPRPRSGQVQRR